MSISLNKKTGINLKKGSSISLEKAGKTYDRICIGVNWGMIKTKQLFGLISSNESVDLDGSVAVFDKDGNRIDLVYYSSLISKDKAIVHSGDDREGDSKTDDFDNEIIEIELNKIDVEATQLVFFLNSYKGQDFAEIPYSKIRIFEGNKREVREVLATFNLSAEPKYAGQTSMVMGKMIRHASGKWEFKAIGEAIRAPHMTQTLDIIAKEYL